MPSSSSQEYRELSTDSYKLAKLKSNLLSFFLSSPMVLKIVGRESLLSSWFLEHIYGEIGRVGYLAILCLVDF